MINLSTLLIRNLQRASEMEKHEQLQLSYREWNPSKEIDDWN